MDVDIFFSIFLEFRVNFWITYTQELNIIFGGKTAAKCKSREGQLDFQVDLTGCCENKVIQSFIKIDFPTVQFIGWT